VSLHNQQNYELRSTIFYKKAPLSYHKKHCIEKIGVGFSLSCPQAHNNIILSARRGPAIYCTLTMKKGTHLQDFSAPSQI
jgi:hypothetical protein